MAGQHASPAPHPTMQTDLASEAIRFPSESRVRPEQDLPGSVRYIHVNGSNALAAHQNLQPASCSFLQALATHSNVQQAATDGNRDRMRPVIGLKLVHEVFDVEVNRSFRNRQAIGDLLVAITVADE